MKLFQINKNPATLCTPVLKILVSIIVLCLMFFRGKIIPMESTAVNTIATVLCILLVGPCIMVFYIAVIEFAYAFKNTMHISSLQSKITADTAKKFRLSEILDLIYQNDIIEVEVLILGNIVRIGSSSDWDRRSGIFFDKAYYINEFEFTSIDDFQIELVRYGISEDVAVISIDGIAQS